MTPTKDELRELVTTEAPELSPEAVDRIAIQIKGLVADYNDETARKLYETATPRQEDGR